jgi:PD-(D/E)XK nuclease superfamily protein
MTIEGPVHEIHTTELRSFRACRRRWHWSFGRDLQPAKTLSVFEFGIAFHKGMEAMYNPETWGAPRQLIAQFAEAAFFDEAQRQKKAFYALQDRGLGDDEERDYDEQVQLGRGMIHWYVMNHLPLAEFVPVYVEVKFQVPILDLEGNQLYCKCDKCWAKQKATDPTFDWDDYIGRMGWKGLPVVYEGRIDVIVRDTRGDYWIVDWKTTIRMMNEDSDVILELDDQVTGYVWALRRQLGLNIRGFRYIELKKGYPKPPTENKVVRLGRSFSINQNQDTDADTFTRTVKTRDAAAYKEGLYDDYISWLQTDGPRFINDHRVYKRPIQLDNFGVHLYQTALEMINPDLALYPSPGRFSCGFCGYREPCLDMEQGGDYEYGLTTMFEVKPRYYAEREATTDHKGIG